MPSIPINGADLFYETFGTLRPGQVPILLIHGSTNTGETTWRTVVRRLEGRYFIILPDCRGHGRSSNPKLTYTFRELAADLAALVRALGYETVHVVGHSNGGNVALLMLMEQAKVTQTCVIQAGNAWVSPDLVAKEPGLFAPAFIERERPAWLRDMKALHSSVHGPDYWRELVRLTVAEIITEPKYTAEDLTKASRPTLIIEGTEDSVNAPMHHGAFMAQHIPAAEFWAPKGIGHSVHEDLLDAWLTHVTQFWERRGAALGEALHRHKLAHHADAREGTFEVRLVEGVLTGTVLTEAMREEVAGITNCPTDRLKVLLTPATARRGSSPGAGHPHGAGQPGAARRGRASARIRPGVEPHPHGTRRLYRLAPCQSPPWVHRSRSLRLVLGLQRARVRRAGRGSYRGWHPDPEACVRHARAGGPEREGNVLGPPSRWSPLGALIRGPSTPGSRPSA